jgi:hypothetical protein
VRPTLAQLEQVGVDFFNSQESGVSRIKGLGIADGGFWHVVPT